MLLSTFFYTGYIDNIKLFFYNNKNNKTEAKNGQKKRRMSRFPA